MVSSLQLYLLNLNMELKPHLLHDRYLQSPVESFLSLLIKDELWSRSKKAAITTRLYHREYYQTERYTLSSPRVTLFFRTWTKCLPTIALSTLLSDSCAAQRISMIDTKRSICQNHIWGAFSGAALSKDSNNYCVSPSQNKWCIVWPETYMQKTCDVAEKASLAKKKLRKKCVNRDKM